MKLEDITTVEQAKALAFDCIQAIELQQQNLRALQQRIAEIQQAPKEKDNNEQHTAKERRETQ